MAEFPSIPLFTDAYLSDTHPELTLEQHGCYLVLMMTQWRRPADSLPDDDKWFCKLLCIHGNKWRVLRETVLERFFEQDDKGNWYQKRLRKERDFLLKSKRKRSENGTKGNHVRWNNNDIGDRNAIAPTPTPTESESYSNSESNNEESETHSSNCRSDDRPRATNRMFDEWWACWRIVGAKKGSRPKAKSKYAALIRSGHVTHEFLCGKVEDLMIHYERESRVPSKFIHPLTWLNNSRWEDELVLDSSPLSGANGNGQRDTLSAAASAIERDQRINYEGDCQVVGRDESLEGPRCEQGSDILSLARSSEKIPTGNDQEDCEGFFDFGGRVVARGG